MQERTMTVSAPDLAAALKDWDAEAKANNWPARATTQEVADRTANYLLDKIEQTQRRRHAD